MKIMQDYQANQMIPSKINPEAKDLSKKRFKKYKKQLLRKQKFQSKVYECAIEKYLKNDNAINILNGLQITTDGIFRHFQSLNYFCFGYSQQNTQKVVEDKNLGIVSIEYQKDMSIEQNSIYDLEQILSKYTNIPQSYALKMLQKVIFIKDKIQNEIEKKGVNKLLISQKDEQLNSFLTDFKKILADFSQNSKSKMFWFSVFRINYQTKNSEIVCSGYSKNYLDLLGADYNTVSQIFNRQKKIDLIKNQQDLTLHALNAINQLGETLKGQQQSPNILHINTFDGFPIKIIEKQNFSSLCSFQNSELVYNDVGYKIVEIEVDPYDLKQLISYRQRISRQKGDMKIEDIIRRELSYLFEDIEYSISSKSFIDQFYSQNLKKLKTFEQIENINNKKRCSHRFIDDSSNS